MKPSHIGNIPKKSASTIITRRISNPAKNNFFNYQILFLKRKSSLSWGNNYAFPGGVTDDSDYQDCDFVMGENYPTLDAKYLNGKKITALRECLEETGLYFSKTTIESHIMKAKLAELLGKHENIEKLLFRDLITVIEPDMDNLTEFVRLITVPFLKRRYDTQFFLTEVSEEKTLNIYSAKENIENINDHHKLLINLEESSEFKWMSPPESLNLFLNKEIELAPPQFMILNILMSFKELDGVHEFLQKAKNKRHSVLNQSALDFPLMICLIDNNEPDTKTKYRYLGMFPEDPEYPVQKMLQFEKCEVLKAELNEKYHNRKVDPAVRSRIYFTDVQATNFFTEYGTNFKMEDCSPMKFLKSQDVLKSMLQQ